ncbi:5405_t:CDS:2 [Gigaspora rosea]|nr:5405_t:CDS:2 [Gigaspora rosea]
MSETLRFRRLKQLVESQQLTQEKIVNDISGDEILPNFTLKISKIDQVIKTSEPSESELTEYNFK